MEITFYKISQDYRVLDKLLGNAIGTATGVLHEKVNDTQMSVKLPSTLFNTVTGSNYCFIDTTQAYYYLESYDIENDCVIINLKMDVRKTFAALIKDSYATITRTENARLADAYIMDNKYISKSYKQIVTLDFPTMLTDFSFILITVG